VVQFVTVDPLLESRLPTADRQTKVDVSDRRRCLRENLRQRVHEGIRLLVREVGASRPITGQPNSSGDLPADFTLGSGNYFARWREMMGKGLRTDEDLSPIFVPLCAIFVPRNFPKRLLPVAEILLSV
jgi:hypothetical protein